MSDSTTNIVLVGITLLGWTAVVAILRLVWRNIMANLNNLHTQADYVTAQTNRVVPFVHSAPPDQQAEVDAIASQLQAAGDSLKAAGDSVGAP